MIMCFTISGLKAQSGMRNMNKGDFKRVEFSDKQKEEIKEIRIEFAKATKDTQNELNELKARQKTLMTANQPDLNEIYSNIDKISDLKNIMMKDRLAMKLDIQSVMTDEQKLLVANRPNRGKGYGQAKGKKGRAHAMRNGKGKGQKRMREARGQNQRRMGDKSRGWKMLDLSDDQKSKMKEMRIAHIDSNKELKNKVEELRLKQKHLMTADKTDENAIMQNADRLSEIQNTLAKKKVEHQMKVREILTEDQLVLFLSRSGNAKGQHRMHRGFHN